MISWVHSEPVCGIVPIQECKNAGKKPRNLLDLIRVDTDKSVDPAHKKIRSILCGREYKTKKHGQIGRALLASLSSSLQYHVLKLRRACLNHDVCWVVEHR